jgi:Leucine-rich repeat (LRR) protein
MGFNSSNGSAVNTSSTALTNAGIKSLSEVTNPRSYIMLRFSDRRVTDLKGLQLFKNLAELNVSGNFLQGEIPELQELPFLKKLNLSNNGIENLCTLPPNLEILNLSYNRIKNLKADATLNLKSLSTLDVTQNGLETLQGVE